MRSIHGEPLLDTAWGFDLVLTSMPCKGSLVVTGVGSLELLSE